MGRLIFSPIATNDLSSIYKYIRKDSPLNAKNVIRTIKDECRKLIKYPGIGREIIKTSKNSIRQIIVYKYRIFYRVLEPDIEIISIYHSSRLIENNAGLQPYFEE